MDKATFTLTLIQEGDTIAIYATHSGPRSTVFEAGMALVAQLAETDSVDETVLCAHTAAPAWVQ